MRSGAPGMREIFVDYNHIGRATHFRTRLFRSEREGLHVGDLVTVVGDAVEPRTARVLSIDEAGAELEIADACTKAGQGSRS